MEPFLGQIVLFAGNFAPRGWAFCDGQLLSIASNTALFSILGTTYGGDGRTTFALPDLRGRVPVGPRTGPGLSTRGLGQRGGTETVTLTEAKMPSHAHTYSPAASDQEGDSQSPGGNYWSADAAGQSAAYRSSPDLDPGTSMGPQVTNDAGGGEAHDNMQPFLGVNYIIALMGVYPSRN